MRFNLHKWKNNFLKMKKDIEMAWSTKKEETRGHYTMKVHNATWHHPYNNLWSLYTYNKE